MSMICDPKLYETRYVVEAVRVTTSNRFAVALWMRKHGLGANAGSLKGIAWNDGSEIVWIDHGQYVVRGNHGEWYVVSGKEFEAKYERIRD